jgi:hypothetical protein
MLISIRNAELSSLIKDIERNNRKVQNGVIPAGLGV